MKIFIIIFIIFQLYYLINGCVFTNYVEIKRYRIRGSLVCFENSYSNYFFRVSLGIKFPSGNHYIMDTVDIDFADGTFSLFGSCMIPHKLINEKMQIFLKISRLTFDRPRFDRLKPFNFKEILKYLANLEDNCLIDNNKRIMYFSDDIELASNYGIINLFNLYLSNYKLYDIFGEVDELTGLLIASDGGKTDSQFQLKSFWKRIEIITGKKSLHL